MRHTLLEPLAGLFFPKRCVHCSSVLPSVEPPGLCGRCSPERPAALPLQSFSEHAPTSLDAVYAASVYSGAMKTLLRAFKYGGESALAVFLSRRLAECVRVQAAGKHFDTVIAVPMDGAKKRRRGYNQSALLAAHLSKNLGLANDSHEVSRQASAKAQSLLTRDERAANVRGCFTVRSETALGGKHILLVDDVFTTGFTALECARTLKEAGASTVSLAVCAKGA